MQLDIKIHFDKNVINETLNYPSQNKVSFPLDPKDQKIKIKKITINEIDANIFHNTTFSINQSEIILKSVHEVSKKGTYTLHIDDLYVRSLRSSCWHVSKSKEDFIFQYEFTHNSFSDTYRDRDHIGFQQKFIPCFGCSFTFGAYQPAEAAWPHLLRKKTGTNYINLGVGGGSIDGIYNNLKLLNKSHNFDRCVILFPNFERRVVRAIVNDYHVRIYSGVNIDRVSSDFHFFKNKYFRQKMQKVRDAIIKDEQNIYSKKILKKLINYCHNNDIKLYASSWDNDVYQNLKTYKNLTVLDKFDLYSHDERADDGKHPHKTHYQSFVDKMVNFL